MHSTRTMREILAVFFFASFRIGMANDLLEDALSCVINEIEDNCFTVVHSAFICILDSSCELDVDKSCGDFNDALECSLNAAAPEAVCSLKNPAQRSEFDIWFRGLESLRDSICIDGLVNDIIRREDNISCWDSDAFEGCIYNHLRIKHIADLLNPQLAKSCFELLISSTSCGVLSMRRHGYCSQNTDLPVHLVGKFFAKSPCGHSDWIWNTPYRYPSPSSVDTRTIDSASLTEVTDSSEPDVSSSSDFPLLLDRPDESTDTATEFYEPVIRGGVSSKHHFKFAGTLGVIIFLNILIL